MEEVEYKIFKQFVEDNQLKKWPLSASPLPMMEEYVDKEGIVLATTQHTIAKTVYRIKTEKNYQSLDAITSLINKKQT